MNEQINILICILDWGLGHATRCYPIVRHLNTKFKVSIASSGQAGALLKKQFPEISHFQLPSYAITYTKRGGLLPFKMLTQISKIKAIVKKETQYIKELQASEHFTHIISDSRPGCFHEQVKNIYLCHQLSIKSVFGSRYLLRKHEQMIKNYHEIWVPDIKEEYSLSGSLSHIMFNHSNIKFIGWLSQFHGQVVKPIHNGKILAILSGPEPQRGLLEKKLLSLQKTLPISIVYGTDSNGKSVLNTSELLTLIAQHEFVLSRSGYTSLMDFLALRKKAVLIPTPGQTEQMYLSKHNKRRNGFAFILQGDLTENTLRNALSKLKHEQLEFPAANMELLLSSF